MSQEILINQLIKSITKSIPMVGGVIEELTFGTLKEIDEKKLKEELQKYRENVSKDLNKISESQRINLVLLMSLISFQREFINKLNHLDKMIEQSVRDNNTNKLLADINILQTESKNEIEKILAEQNKIEKYGLNIDTYLHKNKTKLSTLKEINQWFISPEYELEKIPKKNQPAKLLTYINRWLEKNQNNLLVILGEYGTGKTTLSRKIQYNLLNSQRFIPFYFSLKNLYKNRNTNFVGEFLLKNNISLQLFQKTISVKNTVFILDGFDEISPILSQSVDLFSISDLINYLPKKSKVILTSRTNYFESKKTELKTISKINGLLTNYSGFATVNSNSKVYIKNFSVDKLRIYSKIRMKSNFKDFEKEIINKKYFREISKRPIIADLICSEWESLVGQQLNTIFELYDTIISVWIEREEWRIQDKNRIFQIMESIAIQMLIKDNLSIPLHEIKLTTKELSLDLDFEVLESNIRTCTFLTRDDEGNYEFIHKSFWEFFITRFLIKQILKREITIDLHLYNIIEYGLILEFFRTEINRDLLWQNIMDYQPAFSSKDLNISTSLFSLYFDLGYYKQTDNLKGTSFWKNLIGKLNIHNSKLNEPIFRVK